MGVYENLLSGKDNVRRIKDVNFICVVMCLGKKRTIVELGVVMMIQPCFHWYRLTIL